MPYKKNFWFAKSRGGGWQGSPFNIISNVKRKLAKLTAWKIGSGHGIGMKYAWNSTKMVKQAQK